MTDEILDAVNRYAKGLTEVETRRDKWQLKYKEVRDRLKETAAFLNEKADYKPGFFVDVNHAYNEEINGTCSALPSVTFRCGSMSMHVVFRNAAAEKREFSEGGFALTFAPAITGQVMVFLMPHSSDLEVEKPQEIQIGAIDDPDVLTAGDIDKIVAKAIHTAFYSSYMGFVELEKREEQTSQQRYSPIGFKRHESTEKIK